MGKGENTWYDPAGIFGEPPKPPTPPSPGETATAQTASNVNTAIANAQLNNVNQNTPWGSVNYSSTPGPNGIPNWTQTTTLSPNQQQINTQGEQNSIALGDLARSGISTASDVLGTDFNQRRFDGAAATGGRFDIASALGNYGEDVTNRQFDLASKGLSREFDRSEESLRTRLANQGVNAGAEAFSNEMGDFNEAKGNAFNNAYLMSRAQGQSDRAQALSELSGERTTNLSEALQQYGLDDQADFNARSRPLNEINALQSGSQLSYQPVNPGQAGQYGIGPTDVAGIYNNAYGNQMAGYNAQQQSQAARNSGVASLGAAAITVF